MQVLPDAWATYARFQSQLRGLSALDDHAWGLEGALNVIFEPDFSPELTSVDDFRRAAASASRKRRDHLTRFLTGLEDYGDVPDVRVLLDQISARQALHAIASGVDTPQELSLLSAIGEGQPYGDVAQRRGVAQGSLRSQTLRLRRRFAHLRP